MKEFNLVLTCVLPSLARSFAPLHTSNRVSSLLPSSALAQKIPTSNVSLNAAKKKKADDGDDDEAPYLGPSVEVPDILDFDLTGGRPGAIIESEEHLQRKEEMFEEMEDGTRTYPKWTNDFGSFIEEEEAEYNTNDPDAIDASTLGSYTIRDLQSKFDYEWDPETDDDPNIIDPATRHEYVQEVEVDEEGVEVGYNPIYGPSNPIDTRTKRGAMDSFMIDEKSRNDDILPKQFLDGDLEIGFNEDVVRFRKSLDIIETYTDKFLPDDMLIPRHVAEWYGYPEQLSYPSQNYTNNRFTDPKDLTNFDAMTPQRAQERAMELASAKNAEWLPDGISQEWHKSQRKPYEDIGTLVGSVLEGECDPDIVELIQPALKILGGCADLLSIENGTVFRFYYHGLIKNKFGMAAWTETLIRDCGVEVTGVVFETGFRQRDPSYDSGNPYYGPQW